MARPEKDDRRPVIRRPLEFHSNAFYQLELKSLALWSYAVTCENARNRHRNSVGKHLQEVAQVSGIWILSQPTVRLRISIIESTESTVPKLSSYSQKTGYG
jgi:hypothetical protein